MVTLKKAYEIETLTFHVLVRTKQRLILVIFVILTLHYIIGCFCVSIICIFSNLFCILMGARVLMGF